MKLDKTYKLDENNVNMMKTLGKTKTPDEINCKCEKWDVVANFRDTSQFNDPNVFQ